MKTKQTNKNNFKIFNKSQSFISHIKSGKREFSWEMAKKMSELFPEKTVKEWKKSSFKAWYNRLGCIELLIKGKGQIGTDNNPETETKPKESPMKQKIK